MECQRIPVSPLASHTAHVLHTLNKEMGVLESINIQAQALINLSPLKMIPDFKQQISELERQKQDLESRLKEQAEKIEGKLEEPFSHLNRIREEERMQGRAVEAQSEMHPEGKERLVGAIHEPHEAIKFPKKQPEAEEEVESILQQEASRLSLEKRDLEEELDMKDRMIRRLQDQVKTLTKTTEKGKGG